jgi:hypothetical protein
LEAMAGVEYWGFDAPFDNVPEAFKAIDCS